MKEIGLSVLRQKCHKSTNHDLNHSTLRTASNKKEKLPWHDRIHQRDSRTRRALLQYQNFDFLFYLGWSGCFPQSKHNIMKVVQSLTIYFQKCNNRVGVDLNLFKVLGHTWDPVGSPPGQ